MRPADSRSIVLPQHRRLWVLGLCVGSLMWPASTSAANGFGRADRPAVVLPNPARLTSYALRFPLTVHPQVSLQRLLLPVKVLQGLQVGDYQDLRIFNGLGQAVPMALATVPTGPAKRHEKSLVVYPLASASKAGGMAGVTLDVREDGLGNNQVRIETRPGAKQPAAAPASTGVLLDARAIDEPAVSLSLDIDLPEAQPVRFRAEIGQDLQHWRPLAETVMYRAVGGGSDLGDSRFELRGESLAGHYLRVSWPDALPGTAAPRVRGATVVTQAMNESTERLRAEFKPPTAADPHTLVFSWPFATPVAAIDITPQEVNSVVPFELFGRETGNLPWKRLASAVAYRLQSAVQPQVQTNGPLELPPGRWRDIRIQADPLTPGFLTAPRLNVLFEPVQLIFLTNGPGPFILAAGLASAPAAYLAMDALLPAYSPGQENNVPLASIDLSPLPGASPAPGKAAADGIVELASPQPGPTTRPLSKMRSGILWLVLLAGTGVLAAMALVLMRKTVPATGSPPP
jgi:hypothetical protein